MILRLNPLGGESSSAPIRHGPFPNRQAAADQVRSRQLKRACFRRAIMSSDDEPLRDQGRRLRAECADEERKLWAHLRARRFAGFKFSRQHHIGLYFADFCCVTRHRIIELDSNQHAEPEQECTDLLRTAGLTEQGYRAMRFWNAEVNTEIEDVLEAIYAALPVSLIARLGGCADKGPSLGAAAAPISPGPGEKITATMYKLHEQAAADQVRSRLLAISFHSEGASGRVARAGKGHEGRVERLYIRRSGYRAGRLNEGKFRTVNQRKRDLGLAIGA